MLKKIGWSIWLAFFLYVSANAQQLQISEVIKREIKEGETQTFKISAKENEFFQVLVWQKNTDVQLRLISPNSKTLAEINNSNSPEEPERISYIADETGEYKIEVEFVRSWKTPNNFELKLENLRPSIVSDKSQIEAEKLYNQAIRDAWFSDAPNGKDLALKGFSDAIPNFQNSQDRLGEAFCFYYLGILTYRLNQFQKSIENSSKAAKIFREIKALPQLAVVLSNQAAVHYKFRELRESEVLSNEALEIYRNLDDMKNFAKVGGNLALIAAGFGNNEQAIKRFEEILPVFQSEKDRANEGWVFHNLGSIYDDLGESAKAIQYLQNALKIREEIGEKSQQAVTLVNLGAIFKEIGKPQEALKNMSQALTIFTELGNEINQATCYNNLGGIYEVLGDLPKAPESYAKSLELNRKLGHRLNESANLKNLAVLSAKLGDLPKALEFQAKNLDLIEDFRTKLSQQDLQVKFFASRQNDYELYIDLLMKLHKSFPDKNYDALALQTSERMRARSLLESIGSTELREGIAPDLLEKEKDLRRKINSLEDIRQRFISAKATKEQLAQVEEIIDANLRNLYDIWAKMRESSPKYGNFTQPKPLNLNEIQQSILDENSVLLEYALGSERTYLFVVTKEKLKVIELPKRAEIESVARDFYQNLKARSLKIPNETQTQRQSRLQKAETERQKNGVLLSKILLAPIAKEIENKRLLIVAPEILQYIPFSALANPKNETQYLIETNEIVNLPSASTLATIRKVEHQSAPKDIAIFADPIFSGNDERMRSVSSNLRNNFQRLEFSREEANRIVSMTSAEKRFAAFDSNANLQTLRELDLRQFRILHLATHGILNPKFPELSGVVLSLIDEKGNQRDGMLYLNEIYNLRLNAKLVVLSACETALGKEIQGEGLIGLTHGFMYAGAESVLASLWQVDDYATSELMQRFYQAMLKEGFPPAKALQKAQISMIKEKGLQNPFYWSAFTLQGEWR
ncbi:MAG: CHAT domain-containing protein [Pyrinomonadaceae bacterium]|nr:CHAT domain-containing protein [Pyrinomonadaceae bacterium]